MSKQTELKCRPCTSAPKKLTSNEMNSLLRGLTGWREESEKILRQFEFKNFKEALAFVNQVGELAEELNHHPNILLHDYRKVSLTVWTHSVGGLSENDFVLASQIDSLL